MLISDFTFYTNLTSIKMDSAQASQVYQNDPVVDYQDSSESDEMPDMNMNTTAPAATTTYTPSENMMMQSAPQKKKFKKGYIKWIVIAVIVVVIFIVTAVIAAKNNKKDKSEPYSIGGDSKMTSCPCQRR